jgi:Tfp pilus assembly protein PilF
MNYRRIIVGLMTLTFGILLSSSASFAQNPALRPPDDPWSRLGNDPFDQLEPAAPRTAIEQQVHQMDTLDDVPFAPRADQLGGVQRAETGNTVSVQQLRHPLTRKARRLLAKAESYLKHGQRAKGKEQLTEAVREPSAAPYAHAMLGTEYLRDRQLPDAIVELETAARALPMSGVHSNLGFALCLTGDIKRGQEELEEALRLDGNSAKTRFLLGIVLLNQKSTEAEAQRELNMARTQVRAAHLALAVSEIRRGRTDAAERELREFLGSTSQIEFSKALRWASVAAAQPHPAAAFGFPEKTSD